ncbi:MAG: SDR family NAD(P)-dependent oxidoreductase [Pseudomonadales bacterium]|nr:SDR family NAD(P)-dependent oxidoreductase [Pseudomonadales bacterium]
MTTKPCAMVIGASGGIGDALVQQLGESSRYSAVYAVTRQAPANPVADVHYRQVDSSDEAQIAALCDELKAGPQFTCIICCAGLLHADDDALQVQPEKRLEDISAEQLLAYFKVNSVMPALWIKHSASLLKGSAAATLTVLSARVGSISDNKMGGWYGYRASKAALNMLVKTAQVEYRRRAPNVSLLCYHPGTVDTNLSRPFQRNVPADKLFSAEFTAQQLLQLLPGLTADEGPYYLDWQGKEIAW